MIDQCIYFAQGSFLVTVLHTASLCGMSKRWSCSSLMDGFEHVTKDATADLEAQLVKRMEEHGDPSIIALLFLKGWCSQMAIANSYVHYAHTRSGVADSDQCLGQPQHGADSEGFHRPSWSTFKSTRGWN